MNEDSDPVLSVEQEFSIQSFAQNVQRLTEQQAKALLIELNEQWTIKDAMYRKLLKWRAGSD